MNSKHVRRFSRSFAMLGLALTSASIARAAVGVGDSPSFSVKALDGKPLSLKQFKGKIVVVDFWATWCGPCMAEAPHMVALNKQYADKGLQFVGVSLDDNNQSHLREVISQQGFTWPQAYDGKGWKNALAVAWGVDSIPRTFLLDPDGKVVWTGHPALLEIALSQAFQRTPPVLVDPTVIADAGAKLDAVDAALKSGETSMALASFAAVPAEATKDAALAARVKAARAKLDAAAGKTIADVEALIAQKHFAEADAQLKTIADALPDSPNGKAAEARRDALATDPAYVAQRDAAELAAKQARLEGNAASALESAQAMKANKQDEKAYDAFAAIVRTFPKTAAADAAAKVVAAYEADPKFARKVADARAKGAAEGMLSLARGYRANKRSDLARAKYQAVIDQFPKSSFADAARSELATLVD